MKQSEIDALKVLREQLLCVRESAVGMDLRRINYKIGEIENTLDHATVGDEPHDEPKEQTPQMAAEIIMDIQNRNYGVAEAKAKALVGRLMRDAVDERVWCCKMRKALDECKGYVR